MRALKWSIAASLLSMMTLGCVPVENVRRSSPFERQELDACLAFVIDQSGSFDTIWSDAGYELFLDVSNRFFNESVGTETRLVIAQLSAAKDVVLFEGKPSDLRARFKNPDELTVFLKERSDPSASPVYDSIERVANYLTAISEIGENTQLMTVVISDLVDSEPDRSSKIQSGSRMLNALTRYQEGGGTLAFYCVSPNETPRWRAVLERAGFDTDRYVIETTLVESPLLPSFY